MRREEANPAMVGESPHDFNHVAEPCREPAGRCTNSNRCARAGKCCWETWAAVAPKRSGAI